MAVQVRVCARCGSDAVHPTGWEADEDPLWRVRLRCADCGNECTVVIGPTARMLLARRERERMARWAANFIAALEQDLIDATDFAPPRAGGARHEDGGGGRR